MNRLRFRSPTPLLLLLALIFYIGVPSFPLKFLCLCFGAWMILKINVCHSDLILLFAAFCYSAAFILAPFSWYVFTSPEHPSFHAVTLTQFSLVALGVLWLYFTGNRSEPLSPISSHPLFFLGYALTFLVIFLPSLRADLPYGGDEIYHINSVQLFRIFLDSIPGIAGMLLLFVATGLVLFRKGERHFQAELVLGLATGLMLLIALYVRFSYPSVFTEVNEKGMGDRFSAMFKERLVRYPMAQTWISAFLAVLCRENWEGLWIATEILRFLPLFSLFLLGLLLGSDRRWQDTPVSYTALAVLCFVTIPDFLYHATILYLDMPCVLLMTAVLGDRQFLTAREDLKKRGSWWALILLGFTKETAVPVLLIILVWRAIFHIQAWRAGEQSLSCLLKQETVVWFSALAPIAIYFALRYKILMSEDLYHRTYGAHFANALNISLWLKGFSCLWYQSGAVLLLACYGAWILMVRKEWKTVALCVSLLIAIKGFFICDSDAWVTLPRFNLFLLPPIIVLAWEGLTHLLQQSRRAAGIVLILFMAANLALSPLDIKGNRTWKDVGELWYPYHNCLSDIAESTPTAHILLGNMEYVYGVGVVTGQLRWSNPYIVQMPPYPGEKGRSNLEKTLEAARGFDIVIYRNEGDMELPKYFSCGDFVKTAEYRARFGSLIVFHKKYMALLPWPWICTKQ